MAKKFTKNTNDVPRTNASAKKALTIAQEISWKDLYKITRIAPVPFHLKLTDSEEALSCKEIVRIIPGKRLVAFGNLGAKPVVAKLFYEPYHAARKAKQDAFGVEALMAANIPTPKLLYKGTAQNKRVYVLLFERIWDAKDLDAIWHKKTHPEEYAHLMHAVTIELATQHVMGILQRDLHLKNFLVTGNQIYTLDGGEIEKFNYPLPKEESLDNLGLFFSQLGVGVEQLEEKLFQIYVQSRGWIVTKYDSLKLAAAITKWSKQRWEDYSKKIMRDCSAFSRVQTRNRVMMYDNQYESTALLELLKNPDKAFSQLETKMLKEGRSSTVAKIIVDGRVLVIKRYNIKNPWHWLRRCLRATRAAMNWRLAQHLQWAGIPTAKPVAFVEKHFFGLRGKSYFLMEFVDGEHAGHYFTMHGVEDTYFLPVAEQVVGLFESLAYLQLTHGDLKVTNILIENQRPILIDLDGMLEHTTTSGFKRAFRKEMDRFMKNWYDKEAVAEIFERLVKQMYQRLGLKS